MAPVRGRPDVVVVGGGNAALCAALSARLAGASVLLLERAPAPWRGGNSKYTRNLRHAHGGDELMPQEYTESAFFEDLKRVAGSEPFDHELARLMIRRSRETPRWMEKLGVRWQPPLRGTLQLENTNRFFLGGGKALVNHYYTKARALGVTVVYDARVHGFRFSGTRCVSAVVRRGGVDHEVEGGAFVIASGGFESDRAWLGQSWGTAAAQFKIRGCAYNDGGPVNALLGDGARPEGLRNAFHGTAVDRRSPTYDGGIVTRVDSIPFGIAVNLRGDRFYDEGEDLWPKRYAVWGRLIAEQESQTAFSIFDSKARGRFIPPLYPPIVAEAIETLAHRLEIDPVTFSRTVANFNEAAGAHATAEYDLRELDGRGTSGLEPPKTNWALPLLSPPFYAYPLRPGITFTYFGLGVDQSARVARVDGGSFANVFAAGESMASNVLRRGYLAGVGMTIGTVFGRIAGVEAARCARA